MDVILLQPGNTDFFDGIYPTTTDSTLLAIAHDYGIPLQWCIPVTAVTQGVHRNLTGDPRHPPRVLDSPAFADISLTRASDRFSLLLSSYCARGKPLGEGQQQPTLVYVIHVGEDQSVQLSTTALRDVLVSAIQQQAAVGVAPMEQLLLNFTEILWSHESRQLGLKQTAGWSRLTDGPIGQFTG